MFEIGPLAAAARGGGGGGGGGGGKQVRGRAEGGARLARLLQARLHAPTIRVLPPLAKTVGEDEEPGRRLEKRSQPPLAEFGLLCVWVHFVPRDDDDDDGAETTETRAGATWEAGQGRDENSHVVVREGDLGLPTRQRQALHAHYTTFIFLGCMQHRRSL
jgi:hypothetical protein